jgi:hypothetical protein
MRNREQDKVAEACKTDDTPYIWNSKFNVGLVHRHVARRSYAGSQRGCSKQARWHRIRAVGGAPEPVPSREAPERVPDAPQALRLWLVAVSFGAASLARLQGREHLLVRTWCDA